MLIFRSSRSQMFFKIGVLKKFATFTGKHLCWPLQAFFYRTPTVAASGFSRQQILFFFFWYLLLTVAPAFFPNSFENMSGNFRSSHWNSLKKGVLRNFANFTGKQLCWSLFLIELQPLGLQLYKKRLQHRCFPVEFTKFLRTSNLRTPNLAP